MTEEEKEDDMLKERREEEKEEEMLKERREEEFEVLKSIFATELKDLRYSHKYT